MFSFVPHSLPLSHLVYEENLHIESGSTNSKTNTNEEPQPTRRGLHLQLHDSNISTEPPVTITDLEHSPATIRRGGYSDHSDLYHNHTSDSMPGSATTSESIDSIQCESEDNTAHQSPNMLSPARISSFKFVEFTALHETNEIHRLPSTSSLLSVPPNEFSMIPQTSPSTHRKTSTRSRRRCIFCGGLIKFADRKVANGQHWHQQCFKCATCGRFLDPGKHQEFDGQPYCKLCHNKLAQTHRPVIAPQSPQEKTDIISRIRDYNLYKESSSDFIKYREVDSSLVYEGVIRIYWGLRRHITLSSSETAYRRQRGPRESLYNYVSIDDDGFSRIFENAQKNGDVMSKEDLQELMGVGQNGVDGGPQVTQSLNELGMRKTDSGDSIPEEERVGDDYVLSTQSDGEFDDDSDSENDYENVIPLRQNVVMRQKSDTRPNRIGGEGHIGLKRRSASFKKVQRQRRQAETREQKKSRFIPPYGKPTNLRVSNIQGVSEVITMLLQKFKVENPSSQFSLFVIHDNGAIEVLKLTDSPLAFRLKLGPSEDVAKIYIMESSDSEKVVSQETAEYIKFQVPELNLFLRKYTEEEEREVEKLMKRFEIWKGVVSEQINSLKGRDS